MILEITDRIVEKFNPEHVLVFGSYAKRIADKNSDVDFMVVFSGKICMFNKKWK